MTLPEQRFTHWLVLPSGTTIISDHKLGTQTVSNQQLGPIM